MSFTQLVARLGVCQRVFNASSIAEHEVLLRTLSEKRPSSARAARALHEALLFSMAYAPSASIYELADSAIGKLNATQHTSAQFSLTLNAWLLQRFGRDVEMVGKPEHVSITLETLNHVLDPVEQEMMHAGKMTWKGWSKNAVGERADAHDLLQWIVTMVHRIADSTLMREQLFALFGITTKWTVPAGAPTLLTARGLATALAFHDGVLQRHASLPEALQLPEPRRMQLSRSKQRDLCDVAKGVLCGMQRETDPVTFADESSTMFFDMGMGVGVALYSMQPDKRMALQTYIGFMAFKNRVAIAYGGGWVLGTESGFGVNVFPAYRGGESAQIIAQIMRLYSQGFHVRSFTIDPYQLGMGNPDGIASAAFWMYYRLGFRPQQPLLAALASKEFAKLQRNDTFRTPASVLRQLSHASMRWTDPTSLDHQPLTPDRHGDVVTAFVISKFDGDRAAALAHAIKVIAQKTRTRITVRHPISRIAVLVVASGFADAANPMALRKFVNDYRLKQIDEFTYTIAMQRHLDFFACLYEAEQALNRENM